MCLTIPMQIIAKNGLMVRCEARGEERDASLLMVGEESVAVGDYVLIHLGQVIQTVSQIEAERSWALFDEILAADSLARAKEGE